MSDREKYSGESETVTTVSDDENEFELGARTANAGRGYKQGGKKVRKGDIIALILSVLAAVFMWLYVMGAESPTAEMDFFGVRVQYENAYQLQSEKGLSVISENVQTVDIKLRGKKSTLNRMKSEDIIAYVDLRQVETVGDTRLSVQFTLPEGITCLTEQTVSVRTDERISKTVQIYASVQNYSSAADLILGDLVCELQELTVIGPATLVQRVDCAVAQIDLGGEKLAESRMFSVAPLLYDAEKHPVRSNDLELSNETVTVRLPVYMCKDLDLTVTYKYGYFNEENVALTIEPAKIRVKGEPSVVKELSTVQLGVLDETTIDDDVTYNMAIPLPSGTQLMEGENAAIVRLQHVGTSVKSITLKDLQVDAPEGLKYRLLMTSLDVRVRCATKIYNSLTASAITASIDLQTVGDLVGHVEKKVTVNLTSEYKDAAYVLDEYTVTVELGVSDTPEESSGQIS